MKKMLNYITKGKGLGIKYFVWFSILICVLCWFVFSSILVKNVQNNKELELFFSKVPTLEISGGQLVEPKNTYLSIPIVEGYSDELIINTAADIPVNLNFASGVYLSTEAVYFKMPTLADEIQVITWNDIGDRVIDRASLDQGLKKVVNLFSILLTVIFGIILWLGYILLQMTTKLFFWVLGYQTVKGQTGRASTLSWIGVLSMNFLLIFTPLKLSIPVLFLISVVLAITLIFVAPKQEQEIEKKHAFFDTEPVMEKQKEPLVSISNQPVKVATKKKNLKLVEKPRREATKKTKK